MTTATAAEQEERVDELIDEQATDEQPTEEQETENETATAESETPEPEPKPEQPEPPTEAEIEHEHYEAILEKTATVQQALSEWNCAKEESSAAKKYYDRVNGELLSLISRGPDRQRKLPLGDPEEPSCDDWKAVDVNELDIPAGILNKLYSNNLDTLGDLQAYWDSDKHLNQLDGLGDEYAAQVADAYADYGTKHPELWGEAVEEETDEEPADDEEQPQDDATAEFDEEADGEFEAQPAVD